MAEVKKDKTSTVKKHSTKKETTKKDNTKKVESKKSLKSNFNTKVFIDSFTSNSFTIILSFLAFPLGLLFAYLNKKNKPLAIIYLTVTVISFLIFILIVTINSKYKY